MAGGRSATDAVIQGRAAISVNDPGHPTPPGWRRVALTDVAELGTGHTPSRKHPEYWGGDVPWIGIRDAGAHHGGVIQDTAQHTNGLGLANSAARLLPEGTVCLSRTASVGYVVQMGCPMATSQDFVNWTCGNALEPRFLMQALLAEGDDIRRFGEGSTHTTIYFPEVKAFHIDLPPKEEQRRIVAKIDSLSAKSKRARDRLGHVPSLVRKYRAAVLDSALTGRMTVDWRSANPNEQWSPSCTRNIKDLHARYLRTRRGSRLRSETEMASGELPEGWIAAHLAEAGTLQVGYAYKSAWFSSEGVRLLRGVNVSPGRINWDDEERLSPAMAEKFGDYRLNAGDIVIAMDRPVISSGLKVAVVSADDAGSLLVQRVARYVPGKFVAPEFVWYLINSRIFMDHAVTQAAGSDLPHISANDILTTPLPLPPLREQREIARRIGAAFSWIDRLSADATSARNLINRLDQAVLSKAFRGELVHQDPDDEPVSGLLERVSAARARTAPAGKSRGRPRLAALL